MTPDQLNRAIAEKQGWKFEDDGLAESPSGSRLFWSDVPRYVYSYDAIVPVMEDAYELVGTTMTPLQLATAYSKAEGIWRES